MLGQEEVLLKQLITGVCCMCPTALDLHWVCPDGYWILVALAGACEWILEQRLLEVGETHKSGKDL